MTVVVALSLLHFVWLGAVIGAFAWIAMKLARTANARYYIGVAAMALMAAAPIATATVVQGPVSSVQSRSAGQSPASVQRPVSVQSSSDSGLALDSRRWTLGSIVSPSVAKFLLVAWLIGVGLLSVRLSFGLLAARRLTRVSVQQPGADLLSNARRLMAVLHINRAVTVLESALVRVPTTMGWLKPVVLLPAQAMTGLSIAQIDALVAHELAHVKRHDYLVNLIQSAIETVLFYHPAVWLISRRVRHERELCCDDMAIAACDNDRVMYASALADLESLRQMPEPMLAANGGSLLLRVRHILAPHDTPRTNGQWTAGVVILLMVIVGVASQHVQGRQVVDAVSGAVRGVSDPVRGGVSGGVVGGVKGGVTTGAADGVADGVVGGVKAGIADGVSGGVVGGIRRATIENPISAPPIVDYVTKGQSTPVAEVVASDSSEQTPLSSPISFGGAPRVGPDVLYNTAFSDYAASRYELAVDGFQAYLRDYPSSPNAFKAQFNMGESYFLMSRYAEAAAAYGKVIDTYFNSSWVPDAYYKRGMAFLKQGRNDFAGKDFQSVLDKFPANTLVPLAREQLSRLPVQSPAKSRQMIYVQGEVVTAGEQEWQQGLTLEMVLLRAGDVKNSGAANRIEIRRLNPATNEIIALRVTGDRSKFLIEPNDVIDVPKKRMF